MCSVPRANISALQMRHNIPNRNNYYSAPSIHVLSVSCKCAACAANVFILCHVRIVPVCGYRRKAVTLTASMCCPIVCFMCSKLRSCTMYLLYAICMCLQGEEAVESVHEGHVQVSSDDARTWRRRWVVIGTCGRLFAFKTQQVRPSV